MDANGGAASPENFVFALIRENSFYSWLKFPFCLRVPAAPVENQKRFPFSKAVAARSKFLVRNEAFILFEILLVIANTLLLAAITWPAISSAREGGNTGRCVANLKALHAIAATYASDYSFDLPAYSSPACFKRFPKKTATAQAFAFGKMGVIF
jgi:competence protein ComGC